MRLAGPSLTDRPAGRLLVGTSGFSYPDWEPRFYPPGTRTGDRLGVYATRLAALELHATFRRRPTPSAIAGWVRATPPGFRFATVAQRGSVVRALWGSPEESIAWLTEPLGHFGERLGAVLFRVPSEVRRDGPWVQGDRSVADARFRAFLAAWPRSIPLVVELQDASWHVDETFDAMRAVGAVLCTTDLPPEGDEDANDAQSPSSDSEPPLIRRTGPFLYLRLRRHDYDAAALEAWAARIEPFLAAGDDVFVFFRHDPVGHAAELALDFAERARRG